VSVNLWHETMWKHLSVISKKGIHIRVSGIKPQILCSSNIKIKWKLAISSWWSNKAKPFPETKKRFVFFFLVYRMMQYFRNKHRNCTLINIGMDWLKWCANFILKFSSVPLFLWTASISRIVSGWKYAIFWFSYPRKHPYKVGFQTMGLRETFHNQAFFPEILSMK
jgi:hypothetical protein